MAGESGPRTMISYPHRMRIVGSCFSGLLVLAAVAGWIALPHRLRVQFTTSELITIMLFLVAIVGAIMSVALSTVRTDATGLTIRNALRTRRIEWSQVRRIVYQAGDAWPTLLINNPDDPDKVVVLAIQRTDHDRADRAIAELRRLHAEAGSPP